MSHKRFAKLPEQVAGMMKENLERGVWTGTMPGRDRLSKDLGVSGKTVEAALRQLQAEGILVSQGAGRRRRIVPQKNAKRVSMRIAMLTYDPLALTEGYITDWQHRLTEAGYSAFFAAKSQAELGYNVKRISRLVAQTDADAWIVVAGSQGLLEWFAAQALPVFALFGRRSNLPIAGAGPEKLSCIPPLMERLFELGHQRIVWLARGGRRLPEPGTTEKCFLKCLGDQGITPTSYNLPDWEETVEGLNKCLKSLFEVTPPTAMIVDEAPFFLAVQQFCAGMGIRIPEDLSLISTDDEPYFAWFTPGVSHIRWDRRPMLRSIKRWANNVSRGKNDCRQMTTMAEFIEMGTTGPVTTGPAKQ